MEEDSVKSQADRLDGLEGMMDIMSFSSSEDEEQDETGITLAETAMAVNFVAQMKVLMSTGNPMELLDSSTSSEEKERPWGGFVAGKAPNKARNFQRAKEILYEQYLSGEASTYNEADFERCFRMPREVFMKVKDAVIGAGPFREYVNCSGKQGIDPLVRLTASL